MLRRLNSIAALLLIVVFVFTACAAPAAPTPTVAAPAKAATPTAAPALATPGAGTPTVRAAVPTATTVVQVAPTKPATPAKVDNVTFAIASLSAAYWPINIGRVKNFYKDENINMELLLVTGAPGQLQALLANAAQVSGSQIQAIITAVETGSVKAKLVGNIDASVNYVMVAQKDIKTIAQLKGKRFGVSSPTGGEVALTKKVLQVKGGLGPTDVDWISAGIPSTRVQGLRAGAIDGTIVATPDEEALEKDGFTVLSRYSVDLPNFPFLSYTMTEDFLKASPDVAVRFLRASYKATQWIYNPANKAEAIKILSDEAKMEPAVAAGAYPFFVEQGGLSKDLELTEVGLKNVMDLMIEVGDLKPPAPPWTKYVDMSYLQKAKQP